MRGSFAISRGTMKTSYYLVAAVVCAAVGGAVYAWPAKSPPVHEMVRLTPAKQIGAVLDERALPPIVTDPNVTPASAELPRVPSPAVPMSPLAPASPKLPAVPPPAAPTTPLPAAPVVPPSPIPTVPPPTPLSPPTPLVAPTAPSIGSVVLLDDGKMVEGHVSEAAGKVVVRRGSIDQPFAKDHVQYIGKTKVDCYKFLLGKLKPDDAPGRFKLARWCMYNGLREQALDEAKAVVKLQPDHRLAADMARTMEESIRLFNADGTSKAEPAGLPRPDGPKSSKVVESEPEIGGEAAASFPRHVQPVLVNLCADCHAKPGYTGAFKMACGTLQDSDPAIARHNLKAAVAQVKKGDPGASPLLVKALTAHGGMKEPVFAGRGTPAYRTLEAWVYLAADSKTSPPAVPPVPPAAPPVPPPATKPALPPVPPPDAKKPVAPPVPATEAKPVLPPVPPPSSAPQFGEDARPTVPMRPNPENTGAAVDEFDASIYNRAVQVQAKPAALPAIPQLPATK
jgi:hypothetical protein